MNAQATLTSVVKRDGSVVPFDASKIQSALRRAGAATGEFGPEEAADLAERAVVVLRHRFRGEPPAIERIQDVVEQVLISAERLKTARAYIVYREQHKTLRQDSKTLIDVAASIDEYLEKLD